MMVVEKPRIGSGKGYFTGGWVCVALAFLAAFPASGGVNGAEMIALLLLAVAAALFFVGFWIRLFGLVEARLVDIQRLIYNRTKRPKGDDGGAG